MTKPVRHKRKLRNYLLDKQFQLKYTGIVIGVTAVLSFVLGYYLYREIVVSQNTILARNLSSDTFIIPPTEPAKLMEVTDRVTSKIHDEVSEAARAKLAVVISINNAPAGTTADLYQDSFGNELGRKSTVLGAALGVFLIVLSIFWIYLTHRIAGPVFKLKLLFSKVKGDHIKVEGRLRKGDELQDAFLSFRSMIGRLRNDRLEKALKLDKMIAKFRNEGSFSEDDINELEDLKDQMLASVTK